MASSLYPNFTATVRNLPFFAAVSLIAGGADAAVILAANFLLRALASATSAILGQAVFLVFLLAGLLAAMGWMLSAMARASLAIAAGTRPEYRSLLETKGRLASFGAFSIVFAVNFALAFLARAIAAYLSRGESSLNIPAILILIAALALSCFIVGGACFAFHAAVAEGGGPLACLRSSRKTADGLRARLALGTLAFSLAFVGLYLAGGYLVDLASRGVALGFLGLLADGILLASLFGYVACALGRAYSRRNFAPPLPASIGSPAD
jgi:hypothetical protein